MYALFFLIPVFFLPFTSDVLDFPKQFLLLLLVSVSLLTWFADSLTSGRFNFNFNIANLIALLLLAVTLVSGIYSLYSFGSLWGVPLVVSESFLTLLGLVVLYFLTINLFKREEVPSLIVTLAVSGFLAGLYAIFQMLGLFILPLDFAKSAGFNTVGTVYSLALFLALLLPCVLPSIFFVKGAAKPIMIVSAAVIFTALVLINFTSAWIILAVGSLIPFAIGFSKGDPATRSNSMIVLSFAALFFSAIFITLNIFAPVWMSDIYKGVVKFPGEISLTHRASLDISTATLKQSPKELFLGSGPGTFSYDYSKYKPEQISQTDFWNTKFFSGASEIMNRLATTGILGILALLLFMGFTLFRGFRLLSDASEDYLVVAAVFSGFFAIAVAQFLYPFNMTLTFLFWILAALIIAFDEERIQTVEFTAGTNTALAAPLVFVVLITAQIGLLVWNGKHYYAETKYLQAMRDLSNNDVQRAIDDITVAANNTGWAQDNYLRDLSQVYLYKIREEAAKSTNETETLKAVAPLLGQAVKISTQNTDVVNGNNVSNWAVRGYIYRQLVGLVNDSDNWAIKCYNRAAELEPSNPYLYTELGQVYLMQKNIAAAKENFQKAVAYNQAYSNARYFLGLIYDSEGDKEAALQEFEIVGQLNPDNNEIKTIVENLKAGKPISGEVAQNPPVPANDNGADLMLPAENTPDAENPEENDGKKPADSDAEGSEGTGLEENDAKSGVKTGEEDGGASGRETPGN